MIWRFKGGRIALYNLKRILSIVLVIVIIGQTLINIGLGVYYNLNKEYISKQLCENRNNPAIHCNGHCYLTKQLKKAEEGEGKTAQIMKERDEVMVSECNSHVLVYFPIYSHLENVNYDSALYISVDPEPVIKPPVV